jgi:hypothetical protein
MAAMGWACRRPRRAVSGLPGIGIGIGIRKAGGRRSGGSCIERRLPVPANIGPTARKPN